MVAALAEYCPTTGKVRYATKQSAELVAHTVGNTAYPCKFCRGWHTASPPAQARKRRNRGVHGVQDDA